MPLTLGKFFPTRAAFCLHTVNNGTNDLVDLSGFGRIGAGKSSGQSWENIVSEGFKSTSGGGDCCGRAYDARPSESPGETAGENKGGKLKGNTGAVPTSKTEELTDIRTS
jgi:hypothetical protein